jgi:hypothetical protein
MMCLCSLPRFSIRPVIPAKAGIQQKILLRAATNTFILTCFEGVLIIWIPAFADMTDFLAIGKYRFI